VNIPLEIARAQGSHGIKGAPHGIKGGRPRLDLTDEQRAERRREQKRASKLKRQAEAGASAPTAVFPRYAGTPAAEALDGATRLTGSAGAPPQPAIIATDGRHSPLRGERNTKPKRRKKAKKKARR
jgi:hypothetical protein